MALRSAIEVFGFSKLVSNDSLENAITQMRSHMCYDSHKGKKHGNNAPENNAPLSGIIFGF